MSLGVIHGEGVGGRDSYPSKSQSQFEHEMGGEYEQEVPRRILSDGFQNDRELESRLL